MKPTELRHRLTTQLLQATEPLTLEELAAAAELPTSEAESALSALVDEGLVIAGQLLPGGTSPLFRWAARWREEAGQRARGPRGDLAARLAELEQRFGGRFDIMDEPAATFHDYVIREDTPPPDKRWLVFAQCSVRRPFSASPSHASIRRAIATSSGFDPGTDMARCPVHVVVLASRIGPVPYDLQELYPASVRSGGVKDFDDATYGRYFPVLADRLAEYLEGHGGRYEHVAGFGDGRYGQVLRAARDRAGVEFPVLPRPHGPRLTRVGPSTPRNYWERQWIQLYLTLVDWLDEPARAQAQARLRDLDVEVEGGPL